ncbi:MAG: type II secretion system minor pseudopilin GspI [Steroidobacteraceae bacterium]
MRARGFTLVEVLVALVIVAFAMTALMSTVTSSADSTLYLADRQLAQWIAENRIATLRLQLLAPGKGVQSGSIEYADAKWQWRQEIIDTDVPGLRRIDVQVRRLQPGERETSVTDATGNWLVTVSGIRGSKVAIAGSGGFGVTGTPQASPADSPPTDANGNPIQ